MDKNEITLYNKEKKRIYNREKARLKSSGHWTDYNKARISTKHITNEAVKLIIEQKDILVGNNKKLLFDFEREIVKTKSDITRVANKYINKIELTNYEGNEGIQTFKTNLRENKGVQSNKSNGFSEIKLAKDRLKRELEKSGIDKDTVKKLLDTKRMRNIIKNNLKDNGEVVSTEEINRLIAKGYDRRTNSYKEIRDEGEKLGINNAASLYFDIPKSEQTIKVKGVQHKFLTRDGKHYILWGGFLNEVILDENGKVIAAKGKGLDNE
ncbi:MAG: hypothetical protein LBF68_04615 [Christensenellaceae bacterium]|jgi:hypothetical protein|nr:hypothetical protein [Christensenellaceae bacterium]